MIDLLKHCTLCPRYCGVDRTAGGRGFCGAGRLARVARTMLHTWEEPCLVGTHGAGAVFFAHCTLRCVYCQNYEISHEGHGREMTEEELAAAFLSLQTQGAATLDLVTPTHYTPQILNALARARSDGLTLPVVWNTGGYETEENIARLAGAVDIYLPDLKYNTEESGRLYSAAPGYAAAAFSALRAMVEQVGPSSSAISSCRDTAARASPSCGVSGRRSVGAYSSVSCGNTPRSIERRSSRRSTAGSRPSSMSPSSMSHAILA